MREHYEKVRFCTTCNAEIVDDEYFILIETLRIVTAALAAKCGIEDPELIDLLKVTEAKVRAVFSGDKT